MATAPPGLAQRAKLICEGSLRVSLQAVDELLRDLYGFEDFELYCDGLLDFRNHQKVEEIFRPTEAVSSEDA